MDIMLGRVPREGRGSSGEMGAYTSEGTWLTALAADPAALAADASGLPQARLGTEGSGGMPVGAVDFNASRGLVAVYELKHPGQ